MKKKVAELEGAELDYWVGMAANGTSTLLPWMLGRQISDCVHGVKFGKEKRYYTPSTDWAQGGPIIERERITIEAPSGRNVWVARNRDNRISVRGETALKTAMMAFVMSKFGDEVEV